MLRCVHEEREGTQESFCDIPEGTLNKQVQNNLKWPLFR